jgi:Recombination endonuclease VII
MELISRSDAKERGLKRYYTGRPCPHGHQSQRYVGSMLCVGCLNDRRKLYCKKKKVDGIAVKNKFFTGKPCKHGHTGGRYINTGTCVTCSIEGSRKRRLARSKEENSEYHRKYRIRNLNRIIDNRMLYDYGISKAEYDAIVKAQNNKCAICGLEGSQNQHGRLDIDHDHKTGQVRGLLCNCCNKAIGTVKDNPATLRKAADYLELVNVKDKLLNISEAYGPVTPAHRAEIIGLTEIHQDWIDLIDQESA